MFLIRSPQEHSDRWCGVESSNCLIARGPATPIRFLRHPTRDCSLDRFQQRVIDTTATLTTHFRHNHRPMLFAIALHALRFSQVYTGKVHMERLEYLLQIPSSSTDFAVIISGPA